MTAGVGRPVASTSPSPLDHDGPLQHDGFLARRYVPALDGVRAVAILLVFTRHIGDQRGWRLLAGDNGVTVFFVLSGLLITTLALREESALGRLSLSAFYLRRLFRIYPTYFAVLALYCVTTLVLRLQPDRVAAFTAQLPYYVLGLPEHGFFSGHEPKPPYAGAWSIGIEEKFYLVWPFLGLSLVAGAHRLTRFRLRAGLAVALGTASALAPVLLPWGGYLAPYLFIALGCLGALLLHERATYDRLRPLGARAVLVPLMAAFVALQLLVGAGRLHGRLLDVPTGLLILLVLLGVMTSQGRETAWLRSRPMLFLGRISYVFYLLHNFCLNLVEATPLGRGSAAATVVGPAVSFTASVLVSWAVHVVLERPLTRVGHRLAERRRTASSLGAGRVSRPGGAGPTGTSAG